MPKIAYAPRLARAVELLEASTSRLVGRRDLEEFLGVGKKVAWRVMRECGAQEMPGGSLGIERSQLIDRLRTLAESGDIVVETRRRERLEQLLDAMRPHLKARSIRVVRDEQAAELMATRFKALPPNIDFQPQSLHIDFVGTEDFLAAVGAIVFALENDYEAISDFIEEGT